VPFLPHTPTSAAELSVHRLTVYDATTDLGSKPHIYTHPPTLSQSTVQALTKDRDDQRKQLRDVHLKGGDLDAMIESYRKEVGRLNGRLQEATSIIVEQNEMMQEHRIQLEALEREHMLLREQVCVCVCVCACTFG
jgi:hypothetical protein